MPKRLRRRLWLIGALVVVVWVALFDSHSLWRRASYAAELDRITEENDALATENAALQARLDRGLDAETVEEVAREQYGMRRPGERVYRVETGAAD
jgi:cell division protein FtsB